MLRKKLSIQFSNRLFVITAIVILSVLLGGGLEYRQREIDLMAYLGLAEYVGRPILDIMRAIDPRQSVQILLDFTFLLARLSPAAFFNASPVFIALIVIPWLASHFIHTLYDTKDVKEAGQFLLRNTLGMTELRPLILVKEGRVFVGGGSLCDRVGGRGLLIVYNDSAVVIERGGLLVEVKGPSLSFLKPFERIWEVVDLRPQRWPLTVNAMTKEGIPISCEGIITFKIDDRFVDEDGRVQVKSPVEQAPQFNANGDIDQEIAEELKKAGIGKPLPYTEEAVFNAATCVWMRIHQPDHKEQLRKWTGRVIISGTEGTLRDILANYRLDWLLQSPQPRPDYPREEIREQLEQKLRDSFSVGNGVGAKILSVEIGEIKVRDFKGIEAPEKVYTQWVKTWQAEWEQEAIEDQIEGEADLARLQAAQIQAQAEMVLMLTEAIRPLVDKGEGVPSYLLAMRFFETLRWMAHDPFKRDFLPLRTLQTLSQLEELIIREATPT